MSLLETLDEQRRRFRAAKSRMDQRTGDRNARLDASNHVLLASDPVRGVRERSIDRSLRSRGEQSGSGNITGSTLRSPQLQHPSTTSLRRYPQSSSAGSFASRSTSPQHRGEQAGDSSGELYGGDDSGGRQQPVSPPWGRDSAVEQHSAAPNLRGTGSDAGSRPLSSSSSPSGAYAVHNGRARQQDVGAGGEGDLLLTTTAPGAGQRGTAAFWPPAEAKDVPAFSRSSPSNDASTSYGHTQTGRYSPTAGVTSQPYGSSASVAVSAGAPDAGYLVGGKHPREQSWFLPTHSRSPLSRGVTANVGADAPGVSHSSAPSSSSSYSAPAYQDDVTSMAAAGYGAALRRAYERRERTGIDDSVLMSRDDYSSAAVKPAVTSVASSGARRTPNSAVPRYRDGTRLDSSPMTPLGHLSGFGDPDSAARRTRSPSPNRHALGGDSTALAAADGNGHHRDEAIWILTGEVAALTNDLAKKDVIINRLQ
jgi:hypothetical protein